MAFAVLGQVSWGENYRDSEVKNSIGGQKQTKHAAYLVDRCHSIVISKVKRRKRPPRKEENGNRIKKVQ